MLRTWLEATVLEAHIPACHPGVDFPEIPVTKSAPYPVNIHFQYAVIRLVKV